MERAYAVDASGRIQQHVVSNVGGVEGLVTEPVSPSLIQPRWDGKKWVESASNTERSQALADHRRGCITQLQVEAEAVRGALYPMGPHALAVREQKLREARCLLQGGPKEEPVVLAAEASAAGLDLKTLASQVLEQHAAWCKTQGAVEAVLRKHTDRLNKEKERATLSKVLDAGRAALWALVYGQSAAAPVEELPVEAAPVEAAPVEVAVIAIKEASSAEVAVKEAVEVKR